MIKSKIVKINKIENFDNIYIENSLINKKIDPVRWAIVDVNEGFIIVSVSYNI